jgi:hypothetical protein
MEANGTGLLLYMTKCKINESIVWEMKEIYHKAGTEITAFIVFRLSFHLEKDVVLRCSPCGGQASKRMIDPLAS